MTDIVYGIVLKVRKDGSLSGTLSATKAEFDALKKKAKEAGEASSTAAANTQNNMNAAGAAVQRVGAGFDSLKRIALGYVGVQAAIAAGREWLETADRMALIDARLKRMTGSAKELKDVKAQIYEVAQRLGVSYEELAASTARMAPAIKALGGGAREAAQLAEIVMTTARIQGASTQEAASAAQQFAQALGSGVLQGDELKSILENNGELARVLADGLGVAQGSLKKLGEEGKLTSDVVANAVLKSYAKIQAEGAKIPETFAAGMQRIGNAAAQSVNVLNEQYGITKLLGGAASAVARAMDEQTEAGRKMNAGAEASKDSMAILAIGAAAVVDTVRILIDIASIAVTGLMSLGAAALMAGAAMSGNAEAAGYFGKKTIEYFKQAGVAIGETAGKWQMQGTLAGQVADQLTRAGDAAKRATAANVSLAAGTEMANQKWREATKDLQTVSSINEEYRESMDKLEAAKKLRESANDRRYATEAARMAAQASLEKQFAEAKAGYDRKKQESLETLAKREQTSFQQAIKGAQLEAEAKAKAAQFVFEQAKLYIDEQRDYEQFARRTRLISEQEYIARVGALKVAESDAEIALIRKQIEAEKDLLAQAEKDRSKAIGKDQQEQAKTQIKDLNNKITESENRLTLAIQKRGNVERAVDRDSRVARREALNALTEIDRAGQAYLDNLNRENEDIEFQISLIGKTEAEVRRLTEARRIDLEIQRLNKQFLKDIEESGADDTKAAKIAAVYQEQVAALQQQKTILPELQGRLAAVGREGQAMAEAFRQVDETGFDAFKGLLRGSDEALASFKKLGDFLKNQLYRWLYQMTVQPFVIQAFGAFTGSAGQSIANNVAGQASGNVFNSLLGAGNSASMFGTLGSGIASAGSFLGSSVLQGFGAGLSGVPAAAVGNSAIAAGVGVQGSSAAAGLGNMLAAAGPYIAIAAALFGLYQAFKKSGGPKEGGGFIGSFDSAGRLTGQGDGGGIFGVSTQNDKFADAGKGIAATFFDQLKKLGGTVGNVRFAFGSDQDPRGTAQSRVHNVVDVNGQRVYSVTGRDVGRNAEELQRHLDLEAKRAIVAALKASTLPEEIAAIFNEVDVASASADTLDGLLDLGTALRGLKDSGLSLTIEQLRAMQQSGETLSQTLSRVVQEHGALVTALASVRDAIQGIKADAYDFNKSIGEKIIATGGQFNLTALASGRLDDLRAGIGSESDPARRASAIRTYVGVVDDWLSARRAEIEAQGQAAANAAQAQMDMQRAINEARVAAIQTELAVAKQWADVLNRARSQVKDMQLSTLNPASGNVRYQMAKEMVAAARSAFESATGSARAGAAQRYLEALQSQQGMVPEVFDRPSNEWLAEYNDLQAQLSAVAGVAQENAAAEQSLQQALLSAQHATSAYSAATVQGIGDVSSQVAALNLEANALYEWAREQYNLASGEALETALSQESLLSAQLEAMLGQTALLQAIANNTAPGGATTTTGGSGGTGVVGGGGGGGIRTDIDSVLPVTFDLTVPLSIDGRVFGTAVKRVIVDEGQLVEQTASLYR